MISDKFRRELREQAKLWQAEGLIDTSFYQQLSERYQFNTLETASRNRFLSILMSLGGILLGIGVITFVAANWQVWSREVRVALLLSLFVAVNAAGFYLWRIPPSRSQNSHPNMPATKGRNKLLGEGLLLLGALILGANMALMAQMFHIGGSSYGLFLAWGIGVLGMAYSLRLTSLGVLSALLIGLGYWLAVLDWSSKVEFSWLESFGAANADRSQYNVCAAGLLVSIACYFCHRCDRDNFFPTSFYRPRLKSNLGYSNFLRPTARFAVGIRRCNLAEGTQQAVSIYRPQFSTAVSRQFILFSFFPLVVARFAESCAN